MSVDYNVTVKGLAELRQTLLKTIPDSLQKGTLQRALLAAAKPIIADAQARAPVLTGRLKASIYSFTIRSIDPDVQKRDVSVRTGKKAAKKDQDAFYWKWVEYGHGLITTKKRTLGNAEKGYFGKTVRAVPAHPFMRPAYESQKEAAVAAFAAFLRAKLPDIAAKARGR